MSEKNQMPLFADGKQEDVADETVENEEVLKENGSISTKKRANELDGKTWTKYSISIWSNIRKTNEESALKHPAMFPAELAQRLIEIFTNSKDAVVLDPFLGIGSTLLAAQRLGRKGIGIELNPKFADIARNRASQGLLFDSTSNSESEYATPSVEVITGNSFHVLEKLEKESIDFVVTSPPYWDILNQKRSADGKDIRNYGDEDADLGKVSSYPHFLVELESLFLKVLRTLKAGAYCCIVVMDIRKGDKFFPFHSDIATFMQKIGYIYDDIIIWDRRHEYNNMRPLGYPYVFRVNKAHEFILIFQKPKSLDNGS
jgi:DNA modification methylase